MKPQSSKRTPRADSSGRPSRQRAKPAPRRRDEARELFRQAILDAAETVFAARGFHQARIQDIAEQARIAVGTVYNHFAQKEDVFAALLDARMAAMAEAVAPREGDPAGFEALLTARVGRLLTLIEEHRGFYAIATHYGLFSPPLIDEARALAGNSMRRIERFRAALRALIERGIDEGLLLPIEPRLLAGFLGGAIRALVHVAVLEGKPRVDSLLPDILRLFLHGAARGRHGDAGAKAQSSATKAQSTIEGSAKVRAKTAPAHTKGARR